VEVAQQPIHTISVVTSRKSIEGLGLRSASRSTVLHAPETHNLAHLLWHAAATALKGIQYGVQRCLVANLRLSNELKPPNVATTKLLVLQEYKLIPGHLTLVRRRAIICSIAETCNDHIAVIREGCVLYLISCGIAVRGRILIAAFDP
jgi:hypothetical protein